jgi:class 3 adenylate cyclase/CheY-like chemotaxis protein
MLMVESSQPSPFASDDDDEIIFADEDTEPETRGADGERRSAPADQPTGPDRDPWTILVVDDDDEVHQITRLALQNVQFDNQPLTVLSAHSGGEALELLGHHGGIALVLLDVVMETDDAGLRVARDIREVLHNEAVRIVLRTGQPGQAPERDVIVNYDINDYKTKTELTATKLFTAVITGIRAFRHITTIQRIAEENAQLFANLQTAVEKVAMLEQAKTHLSKFVPQSVQYLIDTNPEALAFAKHETDVSVLFLDIAGYTQMSEALDHDKVSYLVERYFSSFLDDIYANRGDINETAGDGLMIIFQDEDASTHAVQAARTALAIRNKTAQINADHQGTYEPVQVNIGINSGVASVGSSKFEGLAGARWTYTASGAVTNLAARLAVFATEGAVVVGPETARRIQHRFTLDALGAHLLRNISEPVDLFRLVHENADRG